jgi:hypothetical protein
MRIEHSKKESEKLGMPGEERLRPKLFRKNYSYRPDITGDRDNTFKHYLQTNDRFVDVLAEEEKHHLELEPEVNRYGDPQHSVIRESLNEADSPSLRTKGNPSKSQGKLAKSYR